MKKTAVIDYGMGNLLSVTKALQQCGGEVEILADPERLNRFDRCILPGVGNFGDGMRELRARGFEEPVRAFSASGKPLLGICMGMQMLLESSEEAPGIPGLGLIRGSVKRFPAGSEKIPHMGWNSVNFRGGHPFFDGLRSGDFFYFVHSFFAAPDEPENALGLCEYILPFAVAVGKGNTAGVQFHPEKSQNAGLRLLNNFLNAKA